MENEIETVGFIWMYKKFGFTSLRVEGFMDSDFGVMEFRMHGQGFTVSSPLVA